MRKVNFGTKFLVFLLAFLMAFSIITFPSAALAEAGGGPLLSSLSVTYGASDLLGEFSPDKFSYSIDVTFNVDRVSINAAPEAEGDTVGGLGEYTLNTGENIFTVTVSRTADGSSQQYAITINRAEAAGDCSLKLLTVTAGKSQLALDPAFDPAIIDYKAATSADSVDIAAEAADPLAQVAGLGTHRLTEGENIVCVAVTAQNGIVRNYNITVTLTSPIIPAADGGGMSGDYVYSFTGGKATIMCYMGSGGGDITIPDTLDGYPVIAIESGAFAYKTSITGITVPYGVTDIGEEAFRGDTSLVTVSLPESLINIRKAAFCSTAITSINIPKSVTSMEGAFNNCGSLEAINVDAQNTAYSSAGGVLFNKGQTTVLLYPHGKNGTSYSIPPGVTAIGEGTFENCDALAVVNIPAGVAVIGKDAFNGCSSLESAGIPGSVTDIGEQAFYGCSKLTEANIPAVTQSIGTGAFTGCDMLTSINVGASNGYYASEGGVLFKLSGSEKTTLVQYPAKKSGVSYSIPVSVTGIEAYAFSRSTLRDIIVPDGVASIGYNAFSYCDNLYSIEIPDSVVSLDSSFAYCMNLTEVVFIGNCPSSTAQEFDGCDLLTVYYVTGKEGYTSPWNGREAIEFDPAAKHSVTYAATDAESGSVPVDSNTYAYGDAVAMPGNTGGLAKQYYSLSGWNTAENGTGAVFSVGEAYRMGPRDITLYAAWRSSRQLASLQVSGSGYVFPLTPAFSPDIYDYTLKVGNDIDNVSITAKAIFDGDNVVWGSGLRSSGSMLNVGDNVIVITVSSADGQASETYTVTITRHAAADEKTFGYLKYIDEGPYILISKYFGKEAFVPVPDIIDFKPVTKIGVSAFEGNQYVKDVTLPDGITDIAGRAFSGCANLGSVELPDTLKSIGDGAFKGCGRFTGISLNPGLLSIGEEAFMGCSGIAINTGGSIVLPESLVSIGSSAFSNCASITSIAINDNLTSIGSPFLKGCEYLAAISAGSNPNFTVYEGVLFNAGKTTLIKYPAGKGDGSYSIPVTVTDICEAAFEFAQFGSVIIPEGVTELKKYTFANCRAPSLSVSLPDSLLFIDSYVFRNCSGLAYIELPKNLFYFLGDAFYGCTSLSGIALDKENPYFRIIYEDRIICRYNKNVSAYDLVYCPAAYYTAGESSSFTVPSYVAGILRGAFASSRLEEIDIGSSVKYIYPYAFEDCDNLISMAIPDNVKVIDNNAFAGCDNLCTAVIGAGADYVDLNAFSDCPKFAAVYFLGNEPDTVGGSQTLRAITLKLAGAERLPQGMKDRLNELNAPGTVNALAAGGMLFPGCNTNLTVYKAYGTTGYTSPWNGRPVETFYNDQKCTVTFSLNGKAGTAPDSQTVYIYGKAAQPLSPWNPDNRLVGWYREASCVNKWDFAVNTVSSDITLYAKWTNQSVITALTNNIYYGKVTGGQIYIDGTVATLTATPKAGYRFVRWTEAGAEVSVKAIYEFTAASDRTITAQFAAIGIPAITSITPAEPKYSSVTLTWSGVDGAKGYIVYRATSSRGTYTPVKNLTERAFTDTGLQWGRIYYYKVSAYCECATAVTQGGMSAYRSIKPNWEKINLTASTNHNYGVELSWSVPADANAYMDAYYVWYGTYNGNYKKLPEKVRGLSYTFKGLALDKTYYFKLQPVDETTRADVEGPLTDCVKGRAAWAPVELEAASAYNSVTLSWKRDADANYYYVWRRAANGVYEKLLEAGLPIKVYAEGESAEYTDKGLYTGRTYYYKVQPVDEKHGTKGPLSGCTYAKTAWPVLKLTASSKSYNTIELVWNSVAGADTYDIYRGTSCRSINELIAENIPETSHTDKGLERGRIYYYRVVPKDSKGGGKNENTGYRYARPEWPTLRLTAATKNYNSILLSWDKVDGAGYYYVWRRADNGVYEQRLDAGLKPIKVFAEGESAEYTDNGLEMGKTYYYKVQPAAAITGGEEKGPLSDFRRARADWPELILAAAPISYNSIKLTWNMVDGADRYSIYRGTSLTSTFESLGNTDTLAFTFDGSTYTFTDTGLTAGKMYYYRVVPGDSASGRTDSTTGYKYAKPVPSAPDVTLTYRSNGIIGTWPAIAGTAGYEVYRALTPKGTYTKLITTAGLGFWDIPLAAGKAYYYKVSCYTLVNTTTKVYSPYSNIVSRTLNTYQAKGSGVQILPF